MVHIWHGKPANAVVSFAANSLTSYSMYYCQIYIITFGVTQVINLNCSIDILQGFIIVSIIMAVNSRFIIYLIMYVYHKMFIMYHLYMYIKTRRYI